MQAFSCLMYHNVCHNGSLSETAPEWSALSPSIRSYFVEESEFAFQLAAIHRCADLITLEQVQNFFASPVPRQRELGLPDARPSTLITFDDGWRGTLDLAVPILKKNAAQATVFITTNLLDTPDFLRANELHRLPSQLRIGSHCKTHRFLNEMSDTEVRDELLFSKNELERLTGQEVTSVAIPNGAIDDRVRRIALELGYSLIFTSECHLNSRWTGAAHIGRMAIRSRTRPDVVCQFAEGNFGIDPIRCALLSLPKRILGPQRYRQWRAWCLGEKSTDKEMHDLCPTQPMYHFNLADHQASFENRDVEVTQSY